MIKNGKLNRIKTGGNQCNQCTPWPYTFEDALATADEELWMFASWNLGLLEQRSQNSVGVWQWGLDILGTYLHMLGLLA